MKSPKPFGISAICATAMFASQSGAAITLFCTPDATLVTPGQIVTVECFISADAPQVIGGMQIDLPCSLPAGVGSTSGTIDVTNISVDTIHGGFPGDALFGFSGLYPSNVFQCVVGAAPAAGSPAKSIPACVVIPGGGGSPHGNPCTTNAECGTGICASTFYLGTYTFKVSDCAMGEFIIRFEGVSNPSTANDSTRIRDALSGGALVPFTPLEVAITVSSPVGRCCNGVTCLGDLSETCCTVANAGTWTLGASCATDPCPCFSNADCDNNLFCDGVETCNGITATCDPGIFPCVNPNRPFCDEANNACVFCFGNSECDDGVFCNGAELCVNGLCETGANLAAGTLCGDTANNGCTMPDTCNGFGSCLANNQPNGTPCEDGSFCTIGSTCSGGVCVGGAARNCADTLACTSDSCNEGTDQCDNILAAGFCGINGACHAEGTINPLNDCESCSTVLADNAWSPRADGSACIDDGNDCTADECAAGTCAHPPLSMGTPCDDGDPCTGTGRPGIGVDTCDGAGLCGGMLDPECNDDCATAVVAREGATPGNNDNSGADLVEASCQPESNRDIWFKYTATCTGPVQVTTNGSNLMPSNDTVLSVYDACGGTELVCDDDGGLRLLSAVTFSATEGTMYWIRIAGFGNNAGDILLNINTIESCVIDGICYPKGTTNPNNQCEQCQPFASATGWSPRLKGSACGDSTGTVCDSPDACDGAGNCEINFKPDRTPCTDDGNGCTEDICMTGVCEHNNFPATTPCGSDLDTGCDNPDTCDGAGVCLDNFESPGTMCGLLIGTDCDNPDSCDGAGICLANLEPDLTLCASDGVDCTFDHCLGGVCIHPNRNPGDPCGSQAATQCDHPDTCNNNGVCLENLETDGVVCGDGNICTTGDVCISGVCTGTPIPQAPMVVAFGSRVLSVTPQPLGTIAPVALRLTSPDFPCLLKWIDATGQLIDLPVFQLPDDWGTITVRGMEIIPSTLYEVQALCGASLTVPGSDVTWLWGDLDNTQTVDIDDILIMLDGFANDFSSVSLETMDMFPCNPDGMVDIDDILQLLDAFNSAPYPCPPPC